MPDPTPPDASRELEQRVRALQRPDGNLLVLYLLRSLAALVLAPVVFLPLYFKYRTLRYAIDDEGISVSWGILFRRETHLTYRRIQDIHVRRDLLERWLGIGTVQIQTASGSSEAEMSLVGIRHHEAVRDFLYRRMRGAELTAGEARGPETGAPETAAPRPGEAADAAGDHDELVTLLLEIRDELSATRAALESRP